VNSSASSRLRLYVALRICFLLLIMFSFVGHVENLLTWRTFSVTQHLSRSKHIAAVVGLKDWPGTKSIFGDPPPLPRCSHTWERAPAVERWAEFPPVLNPGQSVGLVGQVISLSQGLYLYTNTEKTHTCTNTKHPCPEWDSNPRSRLQSDRRQCTY
jgi:hypothetical protein